MSRIGRDQSNAISTAELGNALAHPMRIQILQCLAQGPGSASTIAAKLDVPLGNVSYHLNEVLDRKTKVVRAVGRRQIRGATETFYVIDAEAILGKFEWPQIPAAVRHGLKGASLIGFVQQALAALQAGQLDARDGVTAAWCPSSVDERAWEEIRAAFADAEERVKTAIRESASRLDGGGGGINAILGIAAFEAAADGEDPDGA